MQIAFGVFAGVSLRVRRKSRKEDPEDAEWLSVIRTELRPFRVSVKKRVGVENPSYKDGSRESECFCLGVSPLLQEASLSESGFAGF